MEFQILSDMAKVFPDEIPSRYAQLRELDVLSGESVHFQIAFRGTEEDFLSLRLKVEGLPDLRLSMVRQVPVSAPTRWAWDQDYLRTEPGLFPDLLEQAADGCVVRVTPCWRSVLVEAPAPAPGEHEIRLSLHTRDLSETLAAETITLRVSPVSLPEIDFRYTRWFHTDSLAEYYKVPVFSEEYWRIVENFLKAAVNHGMSMVLTPVHTPPLDTEIGEERATVQLVRISLNENGYSFDFSLLDRWVDMCRRVGIHYYEIAHLYTQWGAASAPKIMVQTPSGEERLFGWDTPSDGDGYRRFLSAYLPALTGHLRELGIADRCYFHISDEPSEEHLEQYMKVKTFAAPMLKGFKIMDALSHVELFRKGAVDYPVPCNDTADEFLQEAVPERWTYYCCGQKVDVSNSFIAMPGERTRILGIQLYLLQITGFLQWGLNYYYTEHTGRLINPFLCTDGDSSWQGGDPFILYPGADGFPMESLRSRLMKKALEDLRALNALEGKIGRDAVVSMIREEAGMDITLRNYPRSERFIQQVRKRVSEML